MADAWFTQVPDELARCLVDAQSCAERCEAFLHALRERDDTALQRRAVACLVAPAAVARILVDLIDQPPQLVLAAARLCSEAAREAAEALAGAESVAEVVASLRTAAESCEALLEAVP